MAMAVQFQLTFLFNISEHNAECALNMLRDSSLVYAQKQKESEEYNKK